MQAIALLTPPAPRLVPWSRMGDESLARRAAAGSAAAYSALCERYQGPLLAYCRSILLDVEDARDATQSTLENALRALPRREHDRPLRPWLYRIAHNEAIAIVRRRRPAADVDPETVLTVPGPDVASEQRGRLAQLVDDLRLLPERQRGALVMRELSGLSYGEIGGALGLSVEAARRAVFDARTALHDAADGRATACASVRRCLSEGDRRHLRARGVRAHLRFCDDCATFERAMGARQSDLLALGPWLVGAGALSLAGLGFGGAGSAGAAVLAGGSGTAIGAGGGAGVVSGATTTAVAGTGICWAGLPIAAKGIAVAVVVATGGTAVVEVERSARDASAGSQAQAAGARAPVAAAAISQPYDARGRIDLAAVRRREAQAARGARIRTAAGSADARSGRLVTRATPAVPRLRAPAAAPAPAPARRQPPPPSPPAPPPHRPPRPRRPSPTGRRARGARARGARVAGPAHSARIAGPARSARIAAPAHSARIAAPARSARIAAPARSARIAAPARSARIAPRRAPPARAGPRPRVPAPHRPGAGPPPRGRRASARQPSVPPRPRAPAPAAAARRRRTPRAGPPAAVARPRAPSTRRAAAARRAPTRQLQLMIDVPHHNDGPPAW